MVTSTSPPVLFVDVDGVVSVFGFDHGSPPPGRWALVDGIAHFLSTEAGEGLVRLARAFELVWCTGWDDRANDHLPQALGLAGPLETLELQTPSMAHKREAIDLHAPGRAAAWLDDRLDEACDAWAAAREAPTLLVRTDPATGLTGREVERLEAWAAGLSAPRRSAG